LSCFLMIISPIPSRVSILLCSTSLVPVSSGHFLRRVMGGHYHRRTTFLTTTSLT
jgi:hypothetical protein